MLTDQGGRVPQWHVVRRVNVHVQELAIIPSLSTEGKRVPDQLLKQFHVMLARVPSTVAGVIMDNGGHVPQWHVVQKVKKSVPEIAIIPPRSTTGTPALGQQPKRLFVTRPRVQSMEAGVITGNGVRVPQQSVVHGANIPVQEIAIIPHLSTGGARALGQKLKRVFVKRCHVWEIYHNNR